VLVWITKYALTKGIYQVVVEHTTREESVQTLNDSFFSHKQYFHSGEWHATREDAVSRAEQMRDKKIKSMKKMISRLENMDFGQTE
jgi:hypothetical protein